jgi:Flp pilus assembly protein TadG
MKKLLRPLAAARHEAGTAVVEFALVLPVLLILLFGIIDFARALNYQNDLTHLANEGARWAVVNHNPSSSGTLQAYIAAQADTPELKNGSTSVTTPANVQICFPNTSDTIGNPVQVKAKASFKVLPFISGVTIPLSGTSTMRLEQDRSDYAADGPC